MIYNPKISTLEDREDLDKLAMEELYRILIAYEMRIGKDNSQNKEATFKAYKVAEKSKAKMMKKNFLLKILRKVQVSSKWNYP